MAVLRMMNSLSHVLSLLNPGGLPCPAAAVAIAKAEAGETAQWVLSAACPPGWRYLRCRGVVEGDLQGDMSVESPARSAGADSGTAV